MLFYLHGLLGLAHWSAVAPWLRLSLTTDYRGILFQISPIVATNSFAILRGSFKFKMLRFATSCS